MATLEQIQAKLEKLKAQSEALISKQSTAAIEKIRELMSTHGLTIGDIGGQSGGKNRVVKSKVASVEVAKSSAVLYKDPKTGATWSGRGRAPGWIAGSKNRDKFLVDAAETAPTAKVISKTATDNYPRGPQPAKYADPKTGSTWSGRGRAPAWIANVKDRVKFLIEGANQEAMAVEADTPILSPKKTVTKKVAAKKIAAKKAVAKKAASKKVVPRKARAAEEPVTAKKATGRKVVDRKAPEAEEPITTKKAVAKKSPAAKKRVVGKKSIGTPVKRPTVKKVAAAKPVETEPANQSAETVDAPQASQEGNV